MTEHPADPASRNVFLESEPFRQLRPALLDQVFESTHERRYAAGEHMIRQGARGDVLLVLLEGNARVTVRYEDGQSWPIADVSRGTIVGEMALVTQDPTTADVEATAPVRALALPVERFHAIAATHPELTIVLTNVVADRLGQAPHDGLGGKIVEGYRIAGCIGHGGMAVVYEATEVATGHRVALKMLSHRLVYRPDFVARFEREARIVQTLDHVNIAKLRRTFPAFRTEFMVMEFVEGASLSEILETSDPLSEDEARRVLGQLASALVFVHGHGVIHRDLKPSNVLVSRSGRVKLTDFGLARASVKLPDETATLEGDTVGTPVYMAPEQMMGEDSGTAIDVFGFACIASELVSGRKLFEGSSLSSIYRQKVAYRVPPAASIGSGVSEEFRELLVGGLVSEPEKRLDSLREFAAWSGDLPADWLERVF